MTHPLVSIVCTVYNKAPWLKETIEHFLLQETDFSFDILLIDDCSTDGSREIVADYAQRFPDKIRAFYNDTNQGIARTWVKICQEVTADYLARCDGDDYWTDQKKLQKQVDALRMNPQSKWVSTDIDYVNEEGEVIAQAVFESGLVSKAHSFEQMLATRGFTAPSTWLIETELMKEVSQELNVDTADDTFDLQLDLFQRTELIYLPEVTVAYRVNQGSDSRPKEFSKIKHRFNRLLETQLSYLNKYPSSDMRNMLDILLERNNRHELELTKKEFGIAQIGVEQVTVYFADSKGEFCQEQIVQFPIAKMDNISLYLPNDCRRIRIDLSENPSFYDQVKLISHSTNVEVLPEFLNGIVLGDAYLFPDADPQIIYSIPEAFGNQFTLSYRLYDIENIHSEDYFAKILSREMLEMKNELEELRKQTAQQSIILEQRQKDLEEAVNLYNSVIYSRRWAIPTKIINFFRRNR